VRSGHRIEAPCQVQSGKTHLTQLDRAASAEHKWPLVRFAGGAGAKPAQGTPAGPANDHVGQVCPRPWPMAFPEPWPGAEHEASRLLAPVLFVFCPDSTDDTPSRGASAGRFKPTAPDYARDYHSTRDLIIVVSAQRYA
jgi:hypothetical protein